jgi:hypothetical protein
MGGLSILRQEEALAGGAEAFVRIVRGNDEAALAGEAEWLYPSELGGVRCGF